MHSSLLPLPSWANTHVQPPCLRAQTVLEQGGQFAGINRKVQLKALQWSGPRDGGAPEGGNPKPDGGNPKPDAGKPRVTEALLILKHGGVLTHAGRAQVGVGGRMSKHSGVIQCPGGGAGVGSPHADAGSTWGCPALRQRDCLRRPTARLSPQPEELHRALLLHGLCCMQLWQ